MACLHKRFDVADVADEYHRRISRYRILTASKRTRGHVVLHDLDAVILLERDAGNFVERDDIPVTNQTDRTAPHVVEQVGDRRLTAGDQNRARADLLIDVRLACALRPQLAAVVVVLNEGDHAGKHVPFRALAQRRRLHASRPH